MNCSSENKQFPNVRDSRLETSLTYMNDGTKMTVQLLFGNDKMYSTAEFKNVWNFAQPVSLMRFHGVLHKLREVSEELLALNMTIPSIKTSKNSSTLATTNSRKLWSAKIFVANIFMLITHDKLLVK